MSEGQPAPNASVRLRRVLRRSAVLVAAAALLLTAAAAQTPPDAAPRDYEIPAQALDTALNAFIRVSGTQVLYETALAERRRSVDVIGHFTPEIALGMLLSGTGLAARRIDIDAFVIAPAPNRPVGRAASMIRPDGRFLAALQAGILQALCRTPRTRPGDYRIAIALWVGPLGAVERSALIGATGDADRDHMLLAALRGVTIGMAPPVGFPQPFILAVQRRMPRETGDCSG